MKVEFDLTLFDTDKNRKQSNLLNPLELMFDDLDNHLPNEYYTFVENIKFGDKIKITFERIE